MMGLIVKATVLYPATKDYLADYLCDGQPDISVAITPEDIAFERAKSMREAEVEGIPYVDHSDAYLETIALQRKLTEALFERDTLLFHGSVVAVDGQAYLFTAKSGTGKSTHTRLWRQVLGERAVMVNDDKPYLRFTPEGILACGSPWMGKHGLGQNISVPLKAICILERGAENRIRRIEPQEAVSMLFQQSQRPQRTQLLPKYMELIDKLATGVELYRMACNMDPQAAWMAYAAMSGEGKDN
jgi:hypothetical protein